MVDDDEVDRLALQHALEGTALDVVISEAANADAALEAINRTAYDCIFLDYNLPGKNGLELIRKIRQRGIKVPLLVLTGQGDEQTAVALMKAGASDYLPKRKLSSEAIARLIRGARRVYQAERRVEKANLDLREKNALLEKQNRELERHRHYICKQNLQLQEVSRLKSEFLATMSHELRTPLNAIIGFSQILLSKSKHTLSDHQQNMIGRMLANGRNLLELINDILAFSKIEAGRLDLEPAEIDLSTLVSQTVDELRFLADQKSLRLTINVNITDPIVINDAARLRQVLVNLLSNAIKFTDQGSVRVCVGSFCHHGELTNHKHPNCRDTIFLSVSDTGCGISAADLLYIFDPFHQADQKATRKHAGTGLGLAITHSLIQMMHGDITVNSEEGAGTTFRIRIPRSIVIHQGEHALSKLLCSEHVEV